MRIAVIGAGAIGGVFGYFLADQADVTLVDPWPAHVAAIGAGGLRCEIEGVDRVRALRAVTDPAALAPVDLALILVKAAQTAWAAQVAHALLAPAGWPLRCKTAWEMMPCWRRCWAPSGRRWG